MSAINKIPRGLKVLVVMAILGVLVWKFAFNTPYYYYSIGAAAVITIGTIFLIYHSSKSNSAEKKEKPVQNQEALEVQSSLEDVETGDLVEETASAGPVRPQPPKRDNRRVSGSRSIDRLVSFRTAPPPRENAADVAARYFKMAKQSSGIEDPPKIIDYKPAPAPAKPAPGKVPNQAVRSDDPASEEIVAEEPSTSEEPVAEIRGEAGEPPVPLIEDESSLTEEEKNELVNAVWYHCENPYCKYTSFLGVHHIVDEKDGGSNKLDNLIVLCPFCHDLAHRHEIPEKELRDWISDRDERYQFKPDWHYF